MFSLKENAKLLLIFYTDTISKNNLFGNYKKAETRLGLCVPMSRFLFWTLHLALFCKCSFEVLRDVYHVVTHAFVGIHEVHVVYTGEIIHL